MSSPLPILRATPDHLHLLYRRLREAKRLDARRAPGAWSATEILLHLADVEALQKIRVMAMLTEDNPSFFTFDQDAWAQHGHYHSRNPLRAVQLFVQLREHNLELWERLTPEQLARPGQHPKRGPCTVESWLRFISNHDQNHLDQLAASLR
jgi:hypothetical protein